MKHIAAMAFAGLAALPLSSLAGVSTTDCPFTHFLRVGGTEIRNSTLSFRNADLANPAAISGSPSATRSARSCTTRVLRPACRTR